MSKLKLPHSNYKKALKVTTVFLLTTAVLVVFSYSAFFAYFRQRIFPGIKIASVDVGGQTPATALTTLTSYSQNRAGENLTLSYNGQSFTLNLKDAGAEVNFIPQVNLAYGVGRSGNYLEDLNDQFNALVYGTTFTPSVTYKNQPLLASQLAQINQSIKKDVLNSQLILGDTITVSPSSDGTELDDAAVLNQISSYIALIGPRPQTLIVRVIKPQFSEADGQLAKQTLESIKSSPINLYYQDLAWTIDQPTLLSFFDYTTSSTDSDPAIFGQVADIEKASKLKLNGKRLASYLKDLAAKIDQPAQDPRFVFDASTQRVKQFQPSQEGRELDIIQSAFLITQAIANGTPSDINLPVKTTEPKLATSDVNSFGIKDLLGRGISHFAGSIDNRIYNIGLAASRLNGVLIAPGQVFSFNNTVGDISAASGYKQAYVIKSGRTVLDDGGGVCQVSTTLFRSVLNSGLPVVARTAHAYRVGYYEQGFPPGLDATIFAPSVDFQFKNDTPSYILIQAYAAGTTLYIDLYGTNDGRTSTVTTPRITNQTPPPPDLRQDDPTLPKGTVKQVDWSAWGATVTLSRTVTRRGETLIHETYTSNYRPWQAVYLVGTK